MILIYYFLLDKGISSRYPSYITINDTTVDYSYFEKGFIANDSRNETCGYYSINNSFFSNNFGLKGTILHIDEIDKKSLIEFYNTTFTKNFSIVSGGIIYSNSYSTNKYVSFNNCSFIKSISENGNKHKRF